MEYEYYPINNERKYRMKGSVTVIIPSYNRARLLEKTIPTYTQDNVQKIILVDDCSSDNTEEIARRLQKEYPVITYLRQPCNLKQTAAKNRALAEVITTPYVYFGDDDSCLLEKTIDYLLETADKENADVVGACALYADTDADMDDLLGFISRKAQKANTSQELGDICYPETLNFSKLYCKPVRVPVCHACALVKTSVAKAVLYNTDYKGNAYREETDFFLRAAERGAKIYYDSRGAQVNLPMAAIGRTPTWRSRLRFHYYDIRNTCLLLYRHNWYLRREHGYSHNCYVMCAGYVWRKFCRLVKKLLGMKVV